MPIHVPPLSRRRFLALGGAALADAATAQHLGAAEAGVDPHRFALLADTHVPARPDIEARGVNMTDNLRSVVAQLAELDRRPAAALIDGDCAYLKGLPADYANLAKAVRPLGKAGIPLHMTMGNHDNREPFYEALAVDRPTAPPVATKYVSVVESPRANWFLLDSLMQVNVVTGELGEEQLAWLARELDARPEKPAILVGHHNPQFEPPGENKAWSGMRDASKLFSLIAERKQVKAYVFGHTHNWSLDRRDGIHLINLPPVAYVFQDGKPNGWVDAQLLESGLRLTLHAHDPAHRQHGDQHELAWR